jgi:hypothetical protein
VGLDCVVVFPPLWYFPAVPGDLAVAAGALDAAGMEFAVLDLSARLFSDLLEDVGGFEALGRLETWREPALLSAAYDECGDVLSSIGSVFEATFDFDELALGKANPASVLSGLQHGLMPEFNPAIPTLGDAIVDLMLSEPAVVAVALVHPDQRPQAIAFSSMLRNSGYMGKIVLFGTLEDQMSPGGFGDDLARLDSSGKRRRAHSLFLHFDAVLMGEVEDVLPAYIRGESPPGVVGFNADSVSRAVPVQLTEAPLPDWSWVIERFRTPEAIIDVRLGRGCPWGRCTFCAIPSHTPGYRSGGVERLVASVEKAHAQTGSTWFRMRDDLLTPTQLKAVGEAFAALPFDVRWTARARFTEGLTQDVLEVARAGGLDELWMGLESGSEALRKAMDKGVTDATIDAVMEAAEAVGVCIRALTMVGFPGETEADFQATGDWLDSNWQRLSGCAVTPYRPTRGSLLAKTLAYDDPLPVFDRMRVNIPVPVDAAIGPRMEALGERLGDRIMAVPVFDPTLLWVHRSLLARP